MFSDKLVWIRSFIKECRRVLRVTRKPSREEFKTIVKVSGTGIIIVGLIGFVLQMIKTYISIGK